MALLFTEKNLCR